MAEELEADIDVEATRVCDWHVFVNEVFFGAVDQVNPDLMLKTKDIKVGTMGDVVLGKRLISVDGTVKVQAREIGLDKLKLAFPWWTEGTAAPLFMPGDLYDHAVKLRLHPTDLPLTDRSQDLVLVKAAPLPGMKMPRDGEKDDVWEAEFVPFPDRARFPDKYYGYIGVDPDDATVDGWMEAMHPQA